MITAVILSPPTTTTPPAFVDPRPPLLQRLAQRCDFCADFGKGTAYGAGTGQFCGLCTDPRGKLDVCFCYVTNDTHRYQHHLIEIESSPAEMDMNDVGFESEQPRGFR